MTTASQPTDAQQANILFKGKNAHLSINGGPTINFRCATMPTLLQCGNGVWYVIHDDRGCKHLIYENTSVEQIHD